MLYTGSDVIRDVEWVIFDEVHYINDAEVNMLHCCCHHKQFVLVTDAYNTECSIRDNG